MEIISEDVREKVREITFAFIGKGGDYSIASPAFVGFLKSLLICLQKVLKSSKPS